MPELDLERHLSDAREALQFANTLLMGMRETAPLEAGEAEALGVLPSLIAQVARLQEILAPRAQRPARGAGQE